MTNRAFAFVVSEHRWLRVIVIASVLSLVASRRRMLPNVPDCVKDEGFNLGASGLASVWENLLRRGYAQASDKVPKAVLAPSPMVMVNLVPQDAINPLYSGDTENVLLAEEFVLDHLSRSAFDPDKETMEMSTMGRKKILLTKDKETGTIHANGIKVSSQSVLSDGTQLFVLEGILFDYRDRIESAFQNVLAQKQNVPYHGGLGGPSGE